MTSDVERQDADDPYMDERKAGPWLKAIEEAEKAFAHYHDKADNIEKLYANLEAMSASSTEREMKLFWANLEVLKPAIYARKPIPVVTPRFKSRKPLPRAAADVLERCLISSYDMEGLHDVLVASRDDLALVGRGAVWLSYQVDDERQIEAVRYEHLERRDFLHNAARSWAEVYWVAKRAWLSREEGEERFGDAWESVTMEERKDQAVEGSQGEKRGEVWEIWHKTKGVVVWVSPNQDKAGEVLDIKSPPLNLKTFWPCPKPCFGTIEPHTLRPVPDFIYYKDQLEEINELTARISALAEGLKMKGFYAAGNGEIASAVESAMRAADNNAILVPVSNFAALGGASLKDSIIWLPVEEVAATIVQLVALRKQLIEDVYQITGISDIMRGDTNANETATAQQIKSQYGNVRVRDRQEAMIRLSLEVTEIAAEIIAENFSPDSLKKMSQVDDIPSMMDIQQQIMQLQQQIAQAAQDPQIVMQAQQNPEQAQQFLQQAREQIAGLQNQVTFEAVAQLLKDEKTRPFMLDIETNSTIQPDEQADKQSRVEALTAIGGFIAQAGQMVAAQPETAPFAAETLKWVASGFRMGRSMEQAIDEFADQVASKAQQPQGPNPVEMQAEAERAKVDGDMAKHKATLEADMQKHSMEMELRAKELALKEREADLKATEAMVRHVGEDERSHSDAERTKADREAQMEMEAMKNGIPPGYSFDKDREQFQAMIEMMRKNAEVTNTMLQALLMQSAETAKGMAALAAALTAPKSVKIEKDAKGNIIGGTTQIQTIN